MSECAKIRRLLVVQPINWSADEQAQVETHLDACPDCAALDRVYAEQDRLIHSLPPVRFTSSQRGQLLSQIQHESRYLKMQAKLAAVLNVVVTIATIVGITAGVQVLLPASEPVVPTFAPTAVAPAERPEAAPSGQIIFDNGHDIFVMNEDGSALTQLTFAEDVEGNSIDPACSPDGSQIAFISNRPIPDFDLDSDEAIYVMNADGSDQERLAVFPELKDFYDLAWSPDGSRIGFLASDADDMGWWDIYVMNADGSNMRRLTNSQETGLYANSGPVWSPDGSQIVFDADGDGNDNGIYVMNADGSDLRRLLDPQMVVGQESGWFLRSPSWSPDGSRIIFNTYGGAGEVGEGEIFVVDADGENLEQLTNDPLVNYGPTWSPDGVRIAFGTLESEIVVVNPDGLDGVKMSSGLMELRTPRWMSSQAPPLSEDGSREVVLSRWSPGGYAVIPATQVIVASPISLSDPTEPLPTEPAPDLPEVDEATAFGVGGQVHSLSLSPVDTMQDVGMTWVKVQVYQSQDASQIINTAHALGFRVQLTAVGGRLMVTQPDFERDFISWVADLAAAGADAIEVWNEPNIDREWTAGYISPEAYTDLLCAAHAAIKEANPDARVISAGPAPTGYFGGCGPDGCDDLPFLQGMYAAGAGECMDYIGVHYNAGATAPSARSGHPADDGRGYHSWYFVPQMELYYDAFEGTKRLFYTELGYASQEGVPPFPDSFTWAGNTTDAQQADWLAEAVQLSRDSGMVRCAIIWNVNFSRYGDDPQDGYAIIRPDGSCPVCHALNEE